MDPIIGGALVSGGLNLMGGLFQAGAQGDMVKSQQDFQERMSSSAYQRAVADMKAANLNPALMYGSGGPESSPSGSIGTPPNVLEGVSSSAMDVARFGLERASVGAGVAKTMAETTKTLQQIPMERLKGTLAESLQSSAKAVGNVVGQVSEMLEKSSESGPVRKMFKALESTGDEGSSKLYGDWLYNRK